MFEFVCEYPVGGEGENEKLTFHFPLLPSVGLTASLLERRLCEVIAVVAKGRSLDIRQLISVDPEQYSGRPVITGTGTLVQQIMVLYRQSYSADEIMMDECYLTLTQVHAALA